MYLNREDYRAFKHLLYRGFFGPKYRRILWYMDPWAFSLLDLRGLGPDHESQTLGFRV